MKSIIKICNMDSQNDVKRIQDAIVNNSGIVATQISLAKKEVTVIYNEIFLDIENIIECIEDLGYIII